MIILSKPRPKTYNWFLIELRDRYFHRISFHIFFWFELFFCRPMEVFHHFIGPCRRKIVDFTIFLILIWKFEMVFRKVYVMSDDYVFSAFCFCFVLFSTYFLFFFQLCPDKMPFIWYHLPYWNFLISIRSSETGITQLMFFWISWEIRSSELKYSDHQGLQSDDWYFAGLCKELNPELSDEWEVIMLIIELIDVLLEMPKE